MWPDPPSQSLVGRGRRLEYGRTPIDDHNWRADSDPLYEGHGLRCEMQPDYDWGNEYPHAMTQRIADADGNEIRRR